MLIHLKADSVIAFKSKNSKKVFENSCCLHGIYLQNYLHGVFSGHNYTAVPLGLGIKINGSQAFLLCEWTFRTSCFILLMNDDKFIICCCSIG